MTPVLRMPTSLEISPSGPYNSKEGTELPRLTCHSVEIGDMASASNAYTLLCMVVTKTTLCVPLAAIDNPLTTSGCEYTWPSTAKTPSLPNADAFTVAGESWVSCKFELVRSLSPLAVSMLTAAWLSRAQSTVTDISLTHCMESLHRSRTADVGSCVLIPRNHAVVPENSQRCVSTPLLDRKSTRLN